MAHHGSISGIKSLWAIAIKPYSHRSGRRRPAQKSLLINMRISSSGFLMLALMLSEA